MTALEEIKKALVGVTPGPWEVYSEKVADKAAAIAESAYQVKHTEPFVGEIFMLNGGGKCPAMTGCGPCSEANARYIAAVNPAAISELLSTLESLQRETDRLRAEIDRKTSMPGDHRYWEGRYRDEAAENEKLRSVLQPMAKVAGDVSELWPDDAQVVTEIGHFRRARTALASTGGEHHAE